MKPTILLVIIAAVLAAAETKKPTPLSDKDQARAAKLYAKMQTAIRQFAEANAARDAALKGAEETVKQYQANEEALRKASGAPASCRLNEDMEWIRDVPNPQGQARQVPCEIEPEVKK
jgi:predicted Holliday junction resolvase-like endonuclease